jgi:hypothetical protein
LEKEYGKYQKSFKDIVKENKKIPNLISGKCEYTFTTLKPMQVN